MSDQASDDRRAAAQSHLRQLEDEEVRQGADILRAIRVAIIADDSSMAYEQKPPHYREAMLNLRRALMELVWDGLHESNVVNKLDYD